MIIEFFNNSESNVIGGRMLNVSLLRVLAMLMIVLFHCMCYNAGNWSVYPCERPDDLTMDVASVIVSIALPFFFFISGFLFAVIYKNKNGYRDWKAFLVGKLKRLILPTVTWTIIYLILLPFRYTVWEYISGIRHLWFLPTLFVIFIIARLAAPFLLAKRKPYLDLIIAVAVIILTNFSSRIDNDDYLLLKNVLWYIPYFVTGMMFFKHRFRVNYKSIEVIILLFLVGALAQMLLTPPFHGQSFLVTIVLIVICCLTFDLLSVVKMDKDSMASCLLSNLDKNSMGIYLVHQVLIMTLYQYTFFEESWLTYHPYIGPILLFIVVFPLSWAFAEAKRRLKLEPFL